MALIGGLGPQARWSSARSAGRSSLSRVHVLLRVSGGCESTRIFVALGESLSIPLVAGPDSNFRRDVHRLSASVENAGKPSDELIVIAAACAVASDTYH